MKVIVNVLQQCLLIDVIRTISDEILYFAHMRFPFHFDSATFHLLSVLSLWLTCCWLSLIGCFC